MRPRRLSENLARLVLPLAVPIAALGCGAGGPRAVAVSAPVKSSVALPGSGATSERRAEQLSTQQLASAQFSLWLAAFNAKDRDGLVAHYSRYFSEELGRIAVANVDRDLRLSAQIGGFMVVKQEAGAATRLLVTLRERKKLGFASARVEMEARAPDRVARFELKQIATPDEFLTSEEKAAAYLDAAKRQRLIHGIARELRAHYVFPDVAERVITALNDAAARGEFDTMDRGPAFTQAVSKLLRGVSRDGHLKFEFGQRPPAPTGQPMLEEQFKEQNFGFGTIERLEGNVARLVIDGFFSPEQSVREAIASAMTKVADADALILDLRENHGGHPKTVALMASYVFDPPPVHLNDMFRRDDNSTVQFWTEAKVSGTRFGSKKPVYVLTSKRTFSGGEELAYDLKCLGRALIVGETTGGGANPAGPYELDGWFRIFVPWGRAINPITKTNWEGVGVVPDVPVPAHAALEEAHRRALQEIAQTKPPGTKQGTNK